MVAAGVILAVGEENVMQALGKTGILFIAGFGPIVRDADASRKVLFW